MRIFLFYVNTIVGLDEWTDRKLLFEVTKFMEDESKLTMDVDLEEHEYLKKLSPGKNYALQFETLNNKVLKYYYLKAFEVLPPPRGSQIYNLVLHVNKIELS